MLSLSTYRVGILQMFTKNVFIIGDIKCVVSVVVVANRGLRVS